MNSKKIDLSVVTVTYNERENIKLLMEELNNIFKENQVNGEVVVVDDSSPDGTSDVVLQLKENYPLTSLVKRPGKLGIASAYRDGVQQAKGEVIITMDADLSHPPAKLMELYEKAKAGNLALGSRYTGKLKFETDFAHLIGTTMLNKWVSTVLKTRVKDHTNGFLAIRRDVLGKIREHTSEKKLDPFNHILYGIPLTVAARGLGYSVIEIETPYNKRAAGETKISFFKGLGIVFGDMRMALRLRRIMK